jgi:hypothetical protein
MGCAATALTIQAVATTTKLHCQSMFSMREGTMAPANMAPTGTPVCLIENTKAIWEGGVVLARICELAGVIGP